MSAKKSISRGVSVLFIGMLVLIGFSPVHATPSMSTGSANVPDTQFVFNKNTPGMNITVPSAGNEITTRDIILVIDTSSHMAFETTGDVKDPNYYTNCFIDGGHPVPADCVDPLRTDPSSIAHPNGDDPKACNDNISDPTSRCEPLGKVKDAAIDFVDQLLFSYDRVAVISTTEQIRGGDRFPFLVLPFSDNRNDDGTPNTEIQDAIRSLKVFEPRDCPSEESLGGCLKYVGTAYNGQGCTPFTLSGGTDPSSCGSSNIGGNLFLAAEQFAYARQDSSRVVITLFGGPANATNPNGTDPIGFCPPSTYSLTGGSGFCRDLDTMPPSYDAATYNPAIYDWSTYDWVNLATRHSFTTDPAHYDADDYARDGADAITSPDTGAGATIYSICFGTFCRNYPNSNDPASAELLGRYMAEHSGGANANHGYYYFAPSVDGLPPVFQAIANNTLCSPTVVVANNHDAGAGSLRQAIVDVCPGGTINFDAGLSGATINLTSTLTLSQDVTIDGSALASKITISGDTDNSGTGNVRVFSVNNGVTATLNSLVITKGLASSGDGGGIYNSGTLTVTNSTLSGNSATFYGAGGGIYNGGTLTVTNSTLSGNSATFYGAGGGIYNGGTLTVMNSTLSDNSATTGGGIHSYARLLTVTNSTFSGNSATDWGGGIYGYGSTLAVTNSTFSGNSATSGGGVYNFSGTLTVTNSTLSDNSATNGGGGGIYNYGWLTVTNSTLSGNSASSGGGIHSYASLLTVVTNSTLFGNSATDLGGGIYGYGSTLTVTNSTLSGNSATSGGGIYNTYTLTYANTIIANSSGSDCVNNDTIEINTNNLVEDGSCSASLSSDPKLGVLANNGGSTQTMGLLAGSPAIDAGSDAVCADSSVNYLDQRGVTRPQGNHCDIGAYEFVDTTAPIINSITRINPNPTNAAGVDFIVTFSKNVTGVDMVGPVFDDFVLTTSSGITGAFVTGVSGSGSTYTVTVNTGSGNGTIRLDIPAGATVTDLATNPLSGLPFITGEAYTVHRSVDVYIGGALKGSYFLAAGQSTRTNYAGLDSGPVKVESTNGVPIIAAIRDAWSVNGVTTSFSQLMGLPQEQLSNKYVFPGYNNVTLNEQLRIANVDTVQTTVTVTIGGALRGTYTLYPPGSLLGSSAVRINYPGLDSGPVVVEGTAGVKIISAIREAWAVNGVTTSFIQLMGLPAGQFSNKYVFPAYNNVTLNEQLRIANVDTVQSTVTVRVGGVLKGTYTLYPPGSPLGASAVRINYPSLDSGPVIVEGTPNVKIISSIRDAWAVNGVTTSFSQVMGMPAEQLSNKYLFPAYNNVTLNEQLRISNVDTVQSIVTVTIGGVLRGTYTLYPPGSPLGPSAVRINYSGVDSGPVVVEGTAGVDIISAIREAWAVNGVTKSFVQLMGLPAGQLSTTFLFPAYNNVTLNEQLRFGVP